MLVSRFLGNELKNLLPQMSLSYHDAKSLCEAYDAIIF
jgi:hypothetical protein